MCIRDSAHVPQSLLPSTFQTSTQEGLCLVDFQIERGLIKRILVADSLPINDQHQFDLAKKIVLPGFVDIHTHLDRDIFGSDRQISMELLILL